MRIIVFARFDEILSMTLQDIKELSVFIRVQKPLKITNGNDSNRICPLDLTFLILAFALYV